MGSMGFSQGVTWGFPLDCAQLVTKVFTGCAIYMYVQIMVVIGTYIISGVFYIYT